jgi:membrane fusion protein (multidrug efflux system)
MLCLALVPLAGCGGHAGDEEVAAASVAVRTAVVEARPFAQTVAATGVVTPRPGHFVALSAPGPARVARVVATAGQRVAAGDTLVTFERAPFEAAARSADATLSVAQAAHDRAVRLSQAGVLARKEVDQTAADLASAQSAAVTAHRALDLAELRSPIAGVVTTMNAVMGQSADVGQVMVEVADPQALDIVLAVTADAAARVRPGAEVSLTSGEEAAGAESLGTGVVTSVGASVDSVSRAVSVRVHVTHPVRTLRIGESVAGRISIGVHPHALVVPAEALVPDGDAFKVFVVQDGLARARTVSVGSRADSLVEITAGLTAGDTVVTYGAYGLEDSVKVVRSTP